MIKYDIDYSRTWWSTWDRDVSSYTVTEKDLPLFRRLGLKTFAHLPNGENQFLGEVIFPNHSAIARLRLENNVTQFWVCDVRHIAGERDYHTTLRARFSGSLADAWPAMERFIRGETDIFEQAESFDNPENGAYVYSTDVPLGTKVGDRKADVTLEGPGVIL